MNTKSDSRVVVMEGVENGAKVFVYISTAGTTTLLPFYFYVSLLMPTMWNVSWLKQFISVCSYVLFHVYRKTSMYQQK